MFSNANDAQVCNAIAFDPQAPKSLVEFQQQYGARIRNPEATHLANEINPRRSAVYESLLFNNICGYISNCFPVAKRIIGDEQWQQLCRDYFIEWRSHTPYFSQIPRTFIDYIEHKQQRNPDYQQLPRWFAELIDYEWLELEVDTCNAVALHISHEKSGDATFSADTPLMAAPTLRLREFQWPVHTISAEQIPEHEESTFLLLYRDEKHAVQFMAVNAMTFALLNIIQHTQCSARQSLHELARMTGTFTAEQLETFALPLIQEFVSNGLLLNNITR